MLKENDLIETMVSVHMYIFHAPLPTARGETAFSSPSLLNL